MKNIFHKFVFTIFVCLINLPLIAASFNEKIPLYFKLTNENLLEGQNALKILTFATLELKNGVQSHKES